MMNRNAKLNRSAAMTMQSVSALFTFAFDAVRFFSALRYYFYYFFMHASPSERKLAC